MRHAFALIVAAGMCMPATGLALEPAKTDPKTQPAAAASSGGQAAPAEPAAAAAPAEPKGIPVPDGPVVNKTELEGGLIVEDIKIGTGYEVKPGGAVVAHYHGTLKDGGKVFDSSFERGEPVAFPLKGVIEGWQKGVPGMKVGGVRKLTIPSKLGYGERGAGADIPANADLVFTIQLVDALQITDVKEGTGEPASGNCVAVTNYVIKGADGKELEKSDAAKPYIWFPGEFQPIGFGVEGMKIGGKRTLTVPKEMNQSNPMLAGKRPQNVPVTIEIELVNFRDLPGMQRGR